MKTTTVREPTPSDIPHISRIAERGWNATYGDILQAETIDTVLAEWYDEETTRAFIDRDDLAYFLAERNDEVVGYVSGDPTRAEDEATLAAIYVDPDYWNEGIGTALLETFETHCRDRGCDTIQVRVLSENTVGRSFYQKHGYEIVDEREAELFGETIQETEFRGEID